MSRFQALLAAALTALVVALAAPLSASAAGCGDASASPSSVSDHAAVKSTVCLINKQRSARRMRAVRLNGRLSRAAARHAQDMVRRDYFAHTSPSGDTFLQRIKLTGYVEGTRAWTVGENLAWGSGTRATPSAIVSAWMNSPGHRANILNRRFREVGIAIVRGAPNGGPGATYVNTFGSRR
jgi:uncharacterized protein YkwD